jgi:hypothetical protein
MGGGGGSRGSTKKDTKYMDRGGADERSTTAEWSSTTKLHKFVGRNESKANRSLSITAFLVNPPFPSGDNTRAAPPS